MMTQRTLDFARRSTARDDNSAMLLACSHETITPESALLRRIRLKVAQGCLPTMAVIAENHGG
jgi:hypothetical protein